MGNNTVAVIFNDHTSDFKKDGPLGRRVAHAINAWSPITLDGWFGAGRVISRDHSSGYQIVVVHGNTGCRISEANDLPSWQLRELADCLNRHGWRAKPPPRKKRAPATDASKSGEG